MLCKVFYFKLCVCLTYNVSCIIENHTACVHDNVITVGFKYNVLLKIILNVNELFIHIFLTIQNISCFLFIVSNLHYHFFLLHAFELTSNLRHNPNVQVCVQPRHNVNYAVKRCRFIANIAQSATLQRSNVCICTYEVFCLCKSKF